MQSTTTVVEPKVSVTELDQQTLSKQQLTHQRNNKRRRRRARRKAKMAAEQASSSRESVIAGQPQAADGYPSPTPSPTAQLRAELVSSFLQEERKVVVAVTNTGPGETLVRRSQTIDTSSAGNTISAALLKLNDGVSVLINALSPPVTRQVSSCAIPPKDERKRRQIDRRLVGEYDYDVFEDSLDDLFPGRRHCQETSNDFNNDSSTQSWTGGDDKFEYTTSFINGCYL